MANMAIDRKPLMQLAHAKCGWSGTTEDLNEIEGFSCPKCGEPLFPPQWLEKEPTT